MQFYLTPERKALVLAVALAAWVTIGLWLEIYEKLDIRPSAGDPARCGAAVRVRRIVPGGLRIRLPAGSEPLLPGSLFAVYAWVLLLLFRLTAGRVVGVMRREFAAPHYVMVVGTGERAIRMARGLEQSSEYGIRLRGFLSETHGRAGGDHAARAVPGAADRRSAVDPAAARRGRGHLRGR